MIQLQIGIIVNNKVCRLACDVLEREDANDIEREMARILEDIQMEVFKKVAEENGVEYTITEIRREKVECSEP